MESESTSLTVQSEIKDGEPLVESELVTSVRTKPMPPLEGVRELVEEGMV